MPRASLDKRHSEVASMFDATAAAYDRMNDLMTGGIDRLWRIATTKAIDPKPGQRILDIAAGTGASALPLAAAGAEVFPTDLSLGMLQVGHQRHPQFTFVAGDALELPYADEVFDTVTNSFGLRNIDDTVGALAELLRVTRPGGTIVICEFSTPTWAPFRSAYHLYLRTVLPMLSGISSNPSSYNYLAESILGWHDQQTLADMFTQAGWSDVEHLDLSGGIVALHRARKR